MTEDARTRVKNLLINWVNMRWFFPSLNDPFVQKGEVVIIAYPRQVEQTISTW
jgi:hypothetical protein